jgi:Lanthionine synthetase C-like protein
MHNPPEGTDLYYLGWCHGPAGTARLFYQLHRVTGAAEWRTWVERSARGILTSGIPETQTPGFWNNVGQCCGSAGVGEFFLALHRAGGRQDYLAFARRLTDNLLTRGTRDASGLRWTHAEHRVRPEWLQGRRGSCRAPPASARGSCILMTSSRSDFPCCGCLMRLTEKPNE